MQYAFTIYNLQIIFADSKINIDDTQAFTIYNLHNIKIIVFYTKAFIIIC